MDDLPPLLRPMRRIVALVGSGDSMVKVAVMVFDEDGGVDEEGGLDKSSTSASYTLSLIHI